MLSEVNEMNEIEASMWCILIVKNLCGLTLYGIFFRLYIDILIHFSIIVSKDYELCQKLCGLENIYTDLKVLDNAQNKFSCLSLEEKWKQIKLNCNWEYLMT